LVSNRSTILVSVCALARARGRYEWRASCTLRGCTLTTGSQGDPEPLVGLVNSAGAADKKTCGYCGGTLREIGSAPDRLKLTSDRFPYGACTGCGSFTLLDVPANLADFYPNDYYSLAPARAGRLHESLVRLQLSGLPAIASLACCARPSTGWRSTLRAIRFGAPPDWRAQRVLDVGCGIGARLTRLRQVGMHDLVGIDPYLPLAVSEPGFRLLPSTIEAAWGFFDVVLFNHSFEHMDAPLQTFRVARGLLAPHGRILIRIPTVDSTVSRRYGTGWVELDAPRHLHIPSRRALRILAEACDIKLVYLADETSGFEDTGSRPGRTPLLLRCGLEARSYARNWLGRGGRVACLYASA
jgi:SAM-dependent methyltransferase